jgi:hypothetical protein
VSRDYDITEAIDDACKAQFANAFDVLITGLAIWDSAGDQNEREKAIGRFGKALRLIEEARRIAEEECE